MPLDLSDVVAKSLEEISAIDDHIAALAEQAKQARLDAMKPFLDVLAKSGLVSIITVRGSTPGFNDGEPCEHSYETYVNIADHADDEIDTKYIDDAEDFYGTLESRHASTEGFRERNREKCAAIGHVYDRPEKKVMDAIETLITETVDADNGTDYQVTYVLKDGAFEVHTDDYDCGY